LFTPPLRYQPTTDDRKQSDFKQAKLSSKMGDKSRNLIARAKPSDNNLRSGTHPTEFFFALI